HALDRKPLSLGGVTARYDVHRIRVRQIVHQHVMITNAPRVVLHHPVDDPGDVDDADLHPALPDELPRDGLDRGLAQLDEAAGQAPLPERRRLPAPHEQDLVLAPDDGADTDSRVVRILAAHPRPSSQASVPYFSPTRRSMRGGPLSLAPHRGRGRTRS